MVDHNNISLSTNTKPGVIAGNIAGGVEHVKNNAGKNRISASDAGSKTKEELSTELTVGTAAREKARNNHCNMTSVTNSGTAASFQPQPEERSSSSTVSLSIEARFIQEALAGLESITEEPSGDQLHNARKIVQSDSPVRNEEYLGLAKSIIDFNENLQGLRLLSLQRESDFTDTPE